MNKICTSIEQSKKLIELGIDVNTADMLWTYDFTVNDINGLNVISENLKPEEKDIPAWSLTALLGFMPKLYEFEDDLDDGGCQPNLCKGWDNNLWHVVYRFSIYNTEWYDDPIDAAFEMVCWLKQERKI